MFVIRHQGFEVSWYYYLYLKDRRPKIEKKIVISYESRIIYFLVSWNHFQGGFKPQIMNY